MPGVGKVGRHRLAGPFDVTLQWLGGAAPFTIYRSTDPATVTAPPNTLGGTSTRNWVDTPPPANLVYYRITSP